MSSGYAHRCDTCGVTVLEPEDALKRFVPPPDGWFTTVRDREPCNHFCSTRCLLGWAWEEAK